MSLLDTVDGSEPIECGPNLEFDPDFDALDRAAQGKPDQQFGDLVVPAEDPDWKDVASQAESLLQRTKDLRIMGHIAVARLHLSGIPAFASVLTDTRILLVNAWDQVHPQLDPEDDNDPTLRANALLRVGDPRRVLRKLRDIPLAASPRAGRISWRDIGMATGAIEVEEGTEKPTETVILAAFRETDQAALAMLRDAVDTAVREVAAIGRAFDEKAGYGTGPALDDLAKLLGELKRYIGRYGAAPAPVAGTAEEPAGPVDDDQSVPVGLVRAAGGTVTAMSLTTVNSRSEVAHLLELVIDYYARNEPSSPVPLLIDRARRLADKSFMDILRDLAPDGLGQAQMIAGDSE